MSECNVELRPDHPLPPSPPRLESSDELPEALALRELAIEHRPELSALAARVQSEQDAVALACKDDYPDFEVMRRYDTFWADRMCGLPGSRVRP